MFTSSEYRRIARDKLKGHWGISVLVSFIAMLLGANGSDFLSNLNSANSGYNSGAQQGIQSVGEYFEVMAHNFSRMLGFNVSAALLVTVLTSAAVIGIVMSIIGSAVELGHNRYYIELVGENKVGTVGTLFSRFDIFGRALWLRIYMGLKVFAWTLLLVVPGIIAAYRYALAPYIMAEHPELTAREAVEQSKALMAGHKGRLFCLGLSFIGWGLLSALTLGIGSLWLVPYQSAAVAAFYYDRTERNIPMAAGQAYAGSADNADNTTAE